MNVSPNRYPSLQTIELSRTSWTRFAGSLATHAVGLALLIALSRSIPVAETPQPKMVTLIEPATPLKTLRFPSTTPPPLTKVIRRSEIRPVPKPRPFVSRPETAPQLPQAVSTLPDAPQVASLSLPGVQLPKTDPLQIEPPAPRIKVGGFGNPVGASPSPSSAANRPTAPRVGSFDLPSGNSLGRGIASKGYAPAGFGDVTAVAAQGGVHGAVQNGGFADASVAAGPGTVNRDQAPVRAGGFNQTVAAAPVARAAAAAPSDTPVEIMFKPKPAYTSEARARKIEGEVLIEVLFSAKGEVRVLRVTRGLGFGLDETAREAASRIRFRPGTRGGSPIDMKGTVHIAFALS